MGLGGVSRKSCQNILSRGGIEGEGMGRAITIVVGGARESLLANPGTMRIVMKSREGFIKLGIRQGADLVPVLAFGENELYDMMEAHAHPRISRAQAFMRKYLGWTMPLFYGCAVVGKGNGILPHRRPINVGVGKPVKVFQHKEPGAEYVKEIFEAYMKELQRLWDEWKDVFAKDRTGELEFV